MEVAALADAEELVRPAAESGGCPKLNLELDLDWAAEVASRQELEAEASHQVARVVAHSEEGETV